MCEEGLLAFAVSGLNEIPGSRWLVSLQSHLEGALRRWVLLRQGRGLLLERSDAALYSPPAGLVVSNGVSRRGRSP
jgi:hypothetical protein